MAGILQTFWKEIKRPEPVGLRASRPIPSVLQTGDPALLRAQSHTSSVSTVFSPQVSRESSISNKMNSSNLACAPSG